MKKSIILSLFIFTNLCFCQTIKFSSKNENGFFKEYIAKNGNSIKVGDTILIKFPKIGNNYTFITQANTSAGVILANKKVIVSKIKSYNDTVFLLFKGFGLLPVFIEFENAVETKEIELITQ